MTSLAILVAAVVGTVLLMGAVVSPGEGHVPRLTSHAARPSTRRQHTHCSIP